MTNQKLIRAANQMRISNRGVKTVTSACRTARTRSGKRFRSVNPAADPPVVYIPEPEDSNSASASVPAYLPATPPPEEEYQPDEDTEILSDEELANALVQIQAAYYNYGVNGQCGGSSSSSGSSSSTSPDQSSDEPQVERVYIKKWIDLPNGWKQRVWWC